MRFSGDTEKFLNSHIYLISCKYFGLGLTGLLDTENPCIALKCGNDNAGGGSGA